MIAHSAPRPVIGVIACNRITGGEAAQSVMTRYIANAMRYADCAAVIIPSLPELMRAGEVASRIDALLLTGSPSNVGVALYGGSIADAQGPFDAARDTMALDMIEAMIGRARPVFGICRGFQELNVAFGGSLRRDLGDGALPHHAPDGVDLAGMFAHRHSVDLTPGGSLAMLYGRPQIEVNSVHFQGVERLGRDLKIEATAPDGVVEAFSANIGGAPILAVQWHPEWHTADEPQAQALFAHMGEVTRRS